MEDIQQLYEILNRIEKKNDSSTIRGIVIGLVPTLFLTILGGVITFTKLEAKVEVIEEKIINVETGYVKKDNFIKVLRDIDYNFKAINYDGKSTISIHENYNINVNNK